jgi:hypothetical protein
MREVRDINRRRRYGGAGGWRPRGKNFGTDEKQFHCSGKNDTIQFHKLAGC